MHRKLTNANASAYWRSEINSAAGNPCRLWRNMNSVLGEAAEMKPVFSADEYHDMIDAKVADIRNATASADPPIYAVNSASSSLTRLEEVSIEDVVAAITVSASKQCEYDPLPT